jgi:hypothetical protein
MHPQALKTYHGIVATLGIPAGSIQGAASVVHSSCKEHGLPPSAMLSFDLVRSIATDAHDQGGR